MSQVKQLLDSLLWDIYGKQQRQQQTAKPAKQNQYTRPGRTKHKMATQLLRRSRNPDYLKTLSVRKLIDVCAVLKVEIRIMGFFLERVLISRDRNRRHQEILCSFVDAILFVEFHDTHPKMRFSLSPPPPKAAIVTSPTTINNNYNNTNSTNNNISTNTSITNNMLRPTNNTSTRTSGIGAKSLSHSHDATPTSAATANDDDDALSDYNQWLHAMKLVARLPGGMPPEFRRKLWLSLADKYLKSKNVDWSKEEEKCFCEKWREDDEELGIQIVKDLHRTGSNLCTGPAGSINQAKLKRILLGYARYNPEVGYCQGFNMLGALILQVMDKEESESIKVMIYLVEGVLPQGYFCGSMGGLQADMGVFRELMQTKLPRLAKHLQKLQGPIENAYEPPLTNVFTMQWFLTMFCTCLPMSCVLRVWDLVLIEGSDVLLRTALVLWSLLEERVLSARSADEFYGKMGSFSSELLNGHLIDSNGLIEKVVQLGPIPDIQKLRDKHLYNIAPLQHKQGLQLYFDDEEPGSDEESRLAVATVWGIPWGRRGSQSPATASAKQSNENKDRIALDISLLKKQYDRLRERQKQAHIILTTACSTARQGGSSQAPGGNAPSIPVNQLLLGRPAIVTNKGRRLGAPPGTIPPARKPSLPTVLHTKPPEKQLRRGETLHWRDTDLSKRRRDSLTWKEIKADRAHLLREGTIDSAQSTKLRTRMGKSDSSSYSEESDEEDASSTDTSLCDEDDPTASAEKTHKSSTESSPRRRNKLMRKQKDLSAKLQNLPESRDSSRERRRPKSWAPSSNEIPFTLMTSESPANSSDEKTDRLQYYKNFIKEEEDSATECDRMAYKLGKELDWSHTKYSPIAGDLATSKMGALHVQTDIIDLPVITSTSQLSPMPDITTYLHNSCISPLPTPKPLFLDSTNSLGSGDGDGDPKKFDVSDDGVTNQYFERVNSVERPTKLDLLYSLNDEDSIRNAYVDVERISTEGSADISQKADANFKPDGVSDKESNEKDFDVSTQNVKDSELNRRMELLLDYSEKSSAAFIAEATNELSTSLKSDKSEQLKSNLPIREDNIPGENRDDFNEILVTPSTGQLTKEQAVSHASKKRRDPRRLTLTRSSTIEIEERFQELERRIGNEIDSRQSETHSSSHKRIPSTSDLEERYHILEKQMSITKEIEKDAAIDNSESAVRRRHFISKFVDKAESTDSGVPISDVSDSENVPPRKHSRERIPSVADLNSRFNALERQMSSHSLTRRESIELKGNQEEKQEKAEKSKKPEKNTDENLESTDARSDIQNDSTEKTTKSNNEEEKPRLKKLPSTAELEDRFNALERKMSIQKISPSKTKKEPPDEKPKEDDKSKTLKDEADEQKESKHFEHKKQEQSKNVDPVETGDRAEEDKTTSNKKCTESPLKKETKANKSPENLSETSKKKSPPSTEELEKRFNALEKQMSTVTVDNENEEAHKTDKANEENQTTKKSYKSKEESQTDSKQSKSIESFHKKCKEISSEIDNKQSSTEIDSTNKFQEESTKHETTTSKRRASEPPSTEDLEKRYESLKRRMSSNTKTMTERRSSKIEATQKEDIIETTQTKQHSDKQDSTKKKSEAPAEMDEKASDERVVDKEKTESEKADEKLKEKTDRKSDDHLTDTELTELEAVVKNLEESTSAKDQPTIKPSKTSEELNEEKQSKVSNANGNVEIKKEVSIPEAPPLPANYSNEHDHDPANNQRRALIDELESKIKTQTNSESEENLKPSDINPNRKSPTPTAVTPKRTAKVDETSEAHADTAFYGRSENYEPLQTKKMVRRFSDLPSRADLENRLQFLEKQLSKKFNKLRRASDSDVASRRLLIADKPSTSKDQSPPTELEKRVQALEKQLSENSLKLLEAMRARTAQEESSACQSSRRISTETIDATGKELVRYTHFGELEEGDTHKPINISINIKMMLNKDAELKTKKTTNLPTTEELEKRLDKLEQHLKESKVETVPNESFEKTDENQKDVETIEKEKLNENNAEFEGSDEIRIDDLAPESTKIKSPQSTEKERTIQDEIIQEKKDLDVKEDIKSRNENIKEKHDMKDEEKIKVDATENETKTAKQENQEKEHMTYMSEQTRLEQKTDEKIDDNQKQENVPETPKQEFKADTEKSSEVLPNELPQNMVINASEIGPVDPNNKTLVLLLDNEPKSVKVRRLTRANTEELEGLFQALERQLSNRNLVKSGDGKLMRAEEPKPQTEVQKPVEVPKKTVEEMPAPRSHLKRKTVHLPSTKELEARFRSLERQIKLLEDVEKIDVEQRLNEIERKIKLQYSLSHEKDISKYLELCEGKGLDDDPEITTEKEPEKSERVKSPHKSPVRSRAKSPGRDKTKSPYTSPAREKEKTPYTSPTHTKERRSPYTSPARTGKQSPYTSPGRQVNEDNGIPKTEDLEYRYRALDLKRSKSKESLDGRIKNRSDIKKQPIHPLEMLLDSSPDDSEIPTTGELEHRIRVLNDRRKTPSPKGTTRSRSPTIDDIKQQKLRDEQRPKTPVHSLERMVTSPTRRELPTAEELEARMRALEENHTFDMKTQKTFKEFNQKLKDVISPSLSFEEFKVVKSREESPRHMDSHRSTTPKSEGPIRSTSPKVLRFQDEEDDYMRPLSRTEQRDIDRKMVGQTDGVLQMIEENSKMLERILQKSLTDATYQSSISSAALTAATAEGLNAMGNRLMRETSPLRRTGTHTGVPLRTDDNINERLTSIKNTIKSIDTLCEEKPYRKEKCQRYIDSLFSDSVHFAKKASLEDIPRSTQRDYTPSIRISDHSQRPSEYYLSRSMGSVESIRSTSPLRAASPLHHRSQRDLRRVDVSPRGGARNRLEEEREEYESRVRRENMLPNYKFYDNNNLDSVDSELSLIKFHKVDRQLVTYNDDNQRQRQNESERDRTSSHSTSRSPLRSPYGSREINPILMHNINSTTTITTTTTVTHPINDTTINSNRYDLERATNATSPYRQITHQLVGYNDSLKRSNTPVYSPAKLDIRHTTVTSTFYDRLLTEKQIEKTLTRPTSSRSPLISPSYSTKSYLDVMASSSNANSPTAITPTNTTTTTTTTTTNISQLVSYTFTTPTKTTTETAITTATASLVSSNYSLLYSNTNTNTDTTTTNQRININNLSAITMPTTTTTTTTTTNFMSQSFSSTIGNYDVNTNIRLPSFDSSITPAVSTATTMFNFLTTTTTTTTTEK